MVRELRQRETSSMDNFTENSTYHYTNTEKDEPVPYIKKETMENMICRVCIQKGDIPIFGSEDLSVDLSMLTGIEISISDKYPKYLCTSCNFHLQGAIVLKKTAQETDQLLRTQGFCYSINFQNAECIHSLQDDNTSQNECENDYKNTRVEIETKKQNAHLMTTNKVKQSRGLTLTKYDPTKSKKSAPKSSKSKKTIKETLSEAPKEKCPICKRSFRELEKHMEYHRNIAKKSAICDICGKIAKGRNTLDRHRLSHFLDDSALPFKCTLCPYRTRVNSDLRLHMRTHTGDKPYKCPHCPSRSFINSSNLKSHLLTHRTDFDFKCDQCQKGFRRKRDLDKHIKTIHIGIREHACKLCDKSYGARTTLMKHEIRVHKREKTIGGKTPLYKILELRKDLENDTEKES